MKIKDPEHVILDISKQVCIVVEIFLSVHKLKQLLIKR